MTAPTAEQLADLLAQHAECCIRPGMSGPLAEALASQLQKGATT